MLFRSFCGPFRFYSVGEYGERTSRPHYHGNYFGLDIPDIRAVGRRDGFPVFESEIVNKAWGKGFVTIGAVSSASCGYVTKYLMKDSSWQNDYEYTHLQTGEIVQREKPFRLMSRRPGLGFDLYQKYESDFFPSDFCYDNNGNKRPVPAYYRSKLKETDPELYEAIKERRVEAIKDPYARWNSSPERLAVRETCALARSSLRRGSL